MKILIQFGNKGNNLFDHLISPLSRVSEIKNIFVVCRHPGPPIPKVEYHCPPKYFARFSVISVAYESLDLIYLTIFRKPTYLAGFLLFPHGLAAFIVAKLFRKPVIVSLIAGPVELYKIGGSPLGVSYGKPLPWYGKLWLKLLENSDAIITTGSFTRDFLIRNNIEASNIYPMINPPNKSRFYPMDVPKIYDILTVSRLAAVKHNEVIMRVVFEIKKKRPNIKTCFVGDGPDKQSLMQLVNELGINENVSLVGFQANVPYFYNSAKIFVFASEREGFPNVFLEAMACGIPSVVTNCGDISDVAEDGYNSIIINNYDNIDGFTKAIIGLLENEELYRNISRNAVKTVESLSDEKITNQWILLLKTI